MIKFDQLAPGDLVLVMRKHGQRRRARITAIRMDGGFWVKIWTGRGEKGWSEQWFAVPPAQEDDSLIVVEILEKAAP